METSENTKLTQVDGFVSQAMALVTQLSPPRRREVYNEKLKPMLDSVGQELVEKVLRKLESGK